MRRGDVHLPMSPGIEAVVFIFGHPDRRHRTLKRDSIVDCLLHQLTQCFQIADSEIYPIFPRSLKLNRQTSSSPRMSVGANYARRALGEDDV